MNKFVRGNFKFNIQQFAIGNPDKKANADLEIQEKIKNAIENGDVEAFAAAQMVLAQNIEERILNEAKSLKFDEINNQSVMIHRGLNPLTTEEKTYYNEVIGAGGFAGVEAIMPPTVFDRVFEDLRTNHPLLAKIKFVNTSASTEWISRNNDAEAAWWGTLTSAITKKLEVAFKKEKTELYKLSAYVPVCKSMLDLGPQWLDKFVREILFESLAVALELAIVSGTGKEQPIGMSRNLAGAVVDGVYPEKDATVLTDLKPVTLGTKIMAPLTKSGKRAVPEVILIVNPLDYWEKIFSATTVLTASGTYVYGVLPIPATIIQSIAIAKGKMIAGMAKDYFMGVGSTQKIESSDHYKFLEDERTYMSKQYANGKPMDNESFLVFDITNLATEIPQA